MNEVSHHFRPEFLNRIDEVVVFHALLKAEIRAIAEIQLARLKSRLAEQELTLELDGAAIDRLSAVGFDPVYGARPLKRAIQDSTGLAHRRKDTGGRLRPRRPDQGRRKRRATAF